MVVLWKGRDVRQRKNIIGGQKSRATQNFVLGQSLGESALRSPAMTRMIFGTRFREHGETKSRKSEKIERVWFDVHKVREYRKAHPDFCWLHTIESPQGKRNTHPDGRHFNAICLTYSPSPLSVR